ncbi:MAG TPA: M20/M25/M40 family metallo-hydrolase, partial [Pyrinomonadaceae bacterium]|nr:M20/M25/M40 family metallo-hydrolase [Pyrinomonadaceae bacterium]
MASPITTPAPPEETVRDLAASGSVRRAFAYFEARAAEINEEHARICAIPAPPFGEAERAEYLRARLAERGLEGATLDDEGNCLALRRGREETPPLVLSAHLDTVFPAGTDFTVRRDAVGRMRAPGIADDGSGLAALLALAGALGSCDIETRAPVLFVGTVGEEGEGDLRGARHLLTAGEWAGRIDAFLSLDGPGVERITNAAVGSRRYRATFRGAGGHSWG